MCVTVGCRVAGDGPARPCSEGSVCVDDRDEMTVLMSYLDPALGICVPACDPVSPACPTGFVCSPTDGGDHGCLPAGW